AHLALVDAGHQEPLAVGRPLEVLLEAAVARQADDRRGRRDGGRGREGRGEPQMNTDEHRWQKWHKSEPVGPEWSILLSNACLGSVFICVHLWLNPCIRTARR